MDKPHRVVFNVRTGKKELIEFTEAELAQRQADAAAERESKAARRQAEAQERERAALIDKMLAERPDAPKWLKDKVQDA